MPSYITHYTCGVLNYKKLSEGTVKNIIDGAPHAYCVGLAGPDLFFYDFLALLDMDNGTGSVIHKEKTGEFLKNMYEYAIGLPIGKREIALSYYIGFVGHYMLDCNAHPLVFETVGKGTKKRLGQHFCYEAAMDVFTAQCYLLKPVRELNCFNLTRLSAKEERIIFDVVKHVFNKTYGEKISLHNLELASLFFNYHLFTFLLRDKGQVKEGILGRLEKLVFGFRFASPLFINQNTYQYDQRDYNIFRKQFKKGVKEYIHCMPVLENVLNGVEPEENLLCTIGNRSYHTGKELKS